VAFGNENYELHLKKLGTTNMTINKYDFRFKDIIYLQIQSFLSEHLA
jgi:hypothetical protein